MVNGKWKPVLLILFTILFFISGCTSKEIPSAIAEEPIRFVIPYESSEKSRALMALVNEYNSQEIGRSVLLEVYSADYYLNTLLLEYNKNQEPELFLLNQYLVDYMAQEHYLLKVSPFVKKLETRFSGGFYSHTARPLQWEEDYYAIPFQQSSYALLCNTTMLGENNISLPLTWEDVQTNCEVLMNQMNSPFTVTVGEGPQGAEELLSLYAASGLNFYQFDSPSAKEFFTELSNLSKYRYLSPDNINLNQTDLFDEFVTENTAMIVCHSSQIPTLVESKVPFSWEIVPLPSLYGNETAGRMSSGNGLAVSSGVNWEEVEPFLEYLYEEERYIELSLACGSLPVKLSFYDIYQKDSRWVGDVFMEQMEDPFIKRNYRLWPNISSSISKGVFDIITLQYSVDEIAKKIQEAVRGYRMSL